MSDGYGFRAYALGGDEDGLELGRYRTENDAYMDNPGKQITVIYRPTKKKTKKKEFPYNG